jgi:hypothetical protein
MGGYISLAATRGCRQATLILTTAALALCALLLAFAGSASAAPAATKVFPATPAGLSEPGGIAVTPDGEVWASDALFGVCHVDRASRQLDKDEFCAPEPPEPPEPAAGEVEPPAPDPTRPTATFQIVFDSNGCAADPARCNFYVAEGSSGGSGVWRMHWDAGTGTIDEATKIHTDAADQRIQGIALAPDGDVLFSSKRNTNIERIDNPATDPSVPTRVVSTTADVTSLAYLDGTLYIAEGGHLSYAANPDVPSGVATLLPDPADGAVVSSLVADEATGTLFVGTSRPQLTDVVLAYRPVTGYLPGAYDRGFANVTSMAFDTDGDLYIAHDPTAALSPGVDTPGQAELFLRPQTTPNPPDVVFGRQPAAFMKPGPADFAFTTKRPADMASFECTLDRDDATDCTDGTFSAAALGEGPHSLTVRAATVPSPVSGDYGVAETVGFTIDGTNPVVEFAPNMARTAVGGNLRLRISAIDASPVAFKCRVDAGPLFTCGPGDDLVLALGAHTITISGTDAAGNVSAASSVEVTAVPAPRIPVVTTPPTTPAPQTPAAGTAPAPVVVPVTKRKERIDINVPCVAVSASRRDGAELALRGRSARITYRAPAKARYAKFTLRRAADGRRNARIAETLGYARVSRAGLHRSTIALTAAQRRLVRRGVQRLAVAYGTCRTEVGRWQWISGTDSNTAREGQR